MGNAKMRANHVALMRAMAVSRRAFFLFHHTAEWDTTDPITAAALAARPPNVRFVTVIRAVGEDAVVDATLKIAKDQGLPLNDNFKDAPAKKREYSTRPLYLAAGLLPRWAIPDECTHFGWLEHDVLIGNLSLFLPCKDLWRFDVFGWGSSFNLRPWTARTMGSWINPTWAQLTFWRRGSSFDADLGGELSVVKSCYLRTSPVPMCGFSGGWPKTCPVNNRSSSCQDMYMGDGCISSESLRRLRVKQYGHTFGHSWNKKGLLEPVGNGTSAVDIMLDSAGLWHCNFGRRLDKLADFLAGKPVIGNPAVRLVQADRFGWRGLAQTGKHCDGPPHLLHCNRWCFEKPPDAVTPAELDRRSGAWADIELSRGRGTLAPARLLTALRRTRTVALAKGTGTMRCTPIAGWHLFHTFSNAGWERLAPRLRSADRFLIGRIGPTPQDGDEEWSQRSAALLPHEEVHVWDDFGRPLPVPPPLQLPGGRKVP